MGNKIEKTKTYCFPNLLLAKPYLPRFIGVEAIFFVETGIGPEPWRDGGATAALCLHKQEERTGSTNHLYDSRDRKEIVAALYRTHEKKIYRQTDTHDFDH